MRWVLERVTERMPDRLLPAWELARRTVVESIEDRVPGLAAEAAFFALLSLVPLVLAVVGGAGLVARAFGPDAVGALEQVILTLPATLLTAEAFASFRDLVRETLSSGQGRVVSFGFLVALWAGSRAIATYLNALQIAYDMEDGLSAGQRRLLAVGFMLVTSVVGVIVAPAMVIGPEIVRRLLPTGLDVATVQVLRWAFYPTLLAVSVAALASFYHLGVPWDTPWRRDLPGALVAVALWMAGSYGVRVYAALSIRRSEALYGFLATPLVLLVWLYVTSLAVLLGAELNAEIQRLWPHERYGSRVLRHVRGAGRDDAQVPTGGPS